MQKPPKPLLRGYFHEAMFYMSIGACACLVAIHHESYFKQLALVIYSFGLISMFGISAFYHRITWKPKQRLLLKKLDHAGIYLMIAGSFTPIALFSLKLDDANQLLKIIYSIAAVGFVQSIFFVNLPKYISAIFYLIAGYMALPYLNDFQANIGLTNTVWIALGGLIYSLGAVAYALKKPVLKAHIFGYHEVFHICVAVAAILHFVVIFRISF